MKSTTIVVPCYNEAKRLLPELFLDAMGSNPNLSFLFVDDGSRDTTGEILDAMKHRNADQVAILSLEKNVGKAEAVRCGILKVLEGPCDNVGYWDADLATPLDVIGEFCGLLDRGDAEIVIGSRVRLLGRKVERRAWRHYLGRVFATFASLLLEMKIYDSQCGAKIFRNSPHLRQVFSRPFKVKWIFDVEMFSRFPLVQEMPPAELSSSAWVEFPLYCWADVKGSKVGVKVYLRSGIDFCVLFYHLRTPARTAYKRYLATPAAK